VLGSCPAGTVLQQHRYRLRHAKKLIEDSGRKGSFEHQAAVAADTVGDPLKDVAGPALLIFMKLIGMAALLIAGIKPLF